MIPTEEMARAWSEAILRAHAEAKKRWCHACEVASIEPECWMCLSADHLKHFEPHAKTGFGLVEQQRYRERRGRHEFPEIAESGEPIFQPWISFEPEVPDEGAA